jgi:hypothetical protein
VNRLLEHLEDTLSPYQLKVLAIFVWAVSGAAMMLGVALLRPPLVALALVPLFAGIFAHRALLVAGYCPECSKSASQFLPGRLAWLFRTRFGWPERICSNCGHDLTRPPARAETER